MKIGALRANRHMIGLTVVVLIPAINQSGILSTHCALTKERNMIHLFHLKF